ADPDADLDLGQKRHAVFAASITFEVSFLSAVAFRLAHETRVDIQFIDDLEHRFGGDRADDKRELFHDRTLIFTRQADGLTSPNKMILLAAAGVLISTTNDKTVSLTPSH